MTGRALSPRVRWTLLALAGAATLAAVRWVDGGGDPDPLAAVSLPARAQSAAPAAAAAPGAAAPRPQAVAPGRREGADPASGIDLGRLERPPAGKPAGNPFAAANWTPQAIAAAQEKQRAEALAAQPAPPPVAPPLPFAFLGRLIDGERRTVFLTRGERTIIAAEGETFEGSYRVDRVAENAVTFTYLPLQQQQTLSIPAPR